MWKIKRIFQRIIFRYCSFDQYLKILSGGYFALLGMGLLRWSRVYAYPYYLHRLVKNGDTVIDIGANLGYYSRPLSKLVGEGGRVYSVEPVEPIRKVLEHNLRRCGNVEICPFALGDEEGVIRMVNETVSKDQFIGTGQNHVLTDNETVENGAMFFEAQIKRGSEYFASLDRIDFIKCDIEGFEWVVLNDMRPLLERFHPKILVETGDDNRVRLTAYLKELSYGAYVLKDGALQPMSVDDTEDVLYVADCEVFQ